MEGNVSLIVNVVFLPVNLDYPPDVPLIILKCARGEVVFHREGDPEVDFIQVGILTLLNIEIVVVDVRIIP